MWIIIRADEREMTHVDNADTADEARGIIYNELLNLYGGNEDRLTEDIEDGEAEFCDSDMSAWSNHKGNFDIKAFWI